MSAFADIYCPDFKDLKDDPFEDIEIENITAEKLAEYGKAISAYIDEHYIYVTLF